MTKSLAVVCVVAIGLWVGPATAQAGDLGFSFGFSFGFGRAPYGLQGYAYYPAPYHPYAYRHYRPAWVAVPYYNGPVRTYVRAPYRYRTYGVPRPAPRRGDVKHGSYTPRRYYRTARPYR